MIFHKRKIKQEPIKSVDDVIEDLENYHERDWATVDTAIWEAVLWLKKFKEKENK